MKDDPIVAEVRRIRQEHAARFGYDLDLIVEDLKAQEQAQRPTVYQIALPSFGGPEDGAAGCDRLVDALDTFVAYPPCHGEFGSVSV